MIIYQVPVIIVFTKLDRLEFKEQKRLRAEYAQSGLDKATAIVKARQDCIAAALKAYEKSCVGVLKSKLVPPAWARYCAVSNKRMCTFAVNVCSASDDFQIPNRLLNSYNLRRQLSRSRSL